MYLKKQIIPRKDSVRRVNHMFTFRNSIGHMITALHLEIEGPRLGTAHSNRLRRRPMCAAYFEGWCLQCGVNPNEQLGSPVCILWTAVIDWYPCPVPSVAFSRFCIVHDVSSYPAILATWSTFVVSALTLYCFTPCCFAQRVPLPAYVGFTYRHLIYLT